MLASPSTQGHVAGLCSLWRLLLTHRFCERGSMERAIKLGKFGPKKGVPHPEMVRSSS